MVAEGPWDAARGLTYDRLGPETRAIGVEIIGRASNRQLVQRLPVLLPSGNSARRDYQHQVSTRMAGTTVAARD